VRWALLQQRYQGVAFLDRILGERHGPSLPTADSALDSGMLALEPNLARGTPQKS
jgi:hypothetical protein